MEFRILGPLEVVVASESVRLGGPTEQVVLAALIVDADRVVSADRLLDVLWGDDVPDTGLKTLRSYLSRLRGRLKPWGQPIETVADGYVLRTDAGEIDARRFERLLIEARSLRERGNHPAAVGLLEEALSLWRGRALHGLEDHEFARVEAARLKELKLEALESRIDSELEMGRHARLVSEVERLAEEHPLREGLWRSLMVALYRSGRQADALRAFQRVRSVLGEELGIEPSPELKDLEEAILLQSDEVAAPTSSLRLDFVPVARTSFIGREDEVAELLSMLVDHRCITVTGTGGSGKTRLALEVVQNALDDYEDGVLFVELAALSDPDLVPEHLATTLGDVGSHADDVTAAIAEFLAPRNLLLVIDNCEHLAQAAARLVDALLAGCPHLSILATSREPLGAAGEVMFHTPPLQVPDPDTPTADQDAAEAVRLYVDRVRVFDRRFSVDDGNRDAVVSICSTLDGIPLAVELAAARTRAMTPAEIAVRMEDRFVILTDGSRTAPARHQTLKATIDWSYDLCPEASQTALRRLSVFSGGWSLDAAEAVISDEVIDRSEVAGLLARLVDRNLVERSTVAGESRYRLLETIRQYAFDTLVATGEAPTVSGRHCDWYVGLAERAEPELRGTDQIEWWQRLEREHDNLRSAITWSFSTTDPSRALRLVAALGWFWFQRGFWSEAWRWTGRCLENKIEVDPLLRARVIYATGSIEIIRGNVDPLKPFLVEALDACRTAGDQLGEAWSLHYQGHALGWEGAAEAVPLMEQGLEIFEGLRDRWAVAWSWRYLGQHSDDADASIELQTRALDRFFELGDQWSAAFSLYLIGATHLAIGRIDEAEAAERKALEIATELGDVIWKAHAIGRLGMAAYHSGKDDLAAQMLEEGLELHRRIGDDSCTAGILAYQGLLSVRHESWTEAQARFAECLVVRRRLASTLMMALYLGRFAAAVTGGGAPDEGAILFGASCSPEVERLVGTSAEWGTDVWVTERAKLRDQLTSALGDADFERLMAEGKSLGVEAAVNRAVARASAPSVKG
ncbi:MAG: BTAD domain-containing putative transcriptional regulator [Acidimicrobiia bacterium]|nr:MAG: BTAD domain-containing putative transcriptional regulator [Acidimicrobiia bacterium]